MERLVRSRGDAILNLFIILFSIEKTLQHLLTAVFFAVDIPGIGTPDIGPNFQISSQTMVVLNILYFGLFVVGLTGYLKRKQWGFTLLLFLASLDILLEFVFHGFFHITISVIVSTMLILTLFWFRKKTKKTG